jgi:citrate lyase subunit beta/citryl-CoA lyase/(S)-citramalyl-CoA lyase
MARPRRSLLFVPASRPEMIPKALAAGADMVCVDLEDAVPPHLKAEARKPARDFLQAWDGTGPERIVRLNGIRTKAGLGDIAAFADAPLEHGILMLPKVESPEELRIADALLTEAGSALSLAALAESAAGIEHVFRIAAATSRLDFLMFGGADLAAELGAAINVETFAYARSRLLHAAKAAGIDAIDVPCLSFRDDKAVRLESEHARALGFTGKAALHPANVAVVNAAFTPEKAEIDLALRIVAAYEAGHGGATSLDGRLIEKPVVKAMQVILSRARAAGLVHGQ